MGTTVFAFVAGLAVPRARDSATDDHYVITSTKPSQLAAQQEAAVNGGWVLDTDLYPNLTPGLYAVVRGPFGTSEEAARILQRLVRGGGYPGAYLGNAGEIQLPAGLNDEVPPAMIAALLGELGFEVEARPGGENPCEPQQPYHRVELAWLSPSRVIDPQANEVIRSVRRRQVPFGGFWWIDATGSVEHMRTCSE
jgi:hypothetical protein